MRLKELKQLELPASADMHVHLRQGKLMDLIAPQVRRGGVDTVFVMVIQGPLCLSPYTHST
jgi:dihydroorotase